MGDFNVSPEDIDIGIGEQNMKRWLRDGKTSFQPEERDMWNSIKNLGFVDSWRFQKIQMRILYIHGLTTDLECLMMILKEVLE